MGSLPVILPANTSPEVATFCDASLLTLFSAPVLWTVLIRPLRTVANDQSKMYTAIVESSRDGILVVDKDGTIESANAAVLDCFQVPPQKWIGKSIVSIFPEFGAEQSIYDSLSALSKNTDSLSCGEVAVEVQGLTRYFELRANQLPTPERKRYALLVRDVTERRQIQRNLEEANRQLVETAHRAGKAEVAACVIHNVGNVLTNVNVLTSAVASKVRNSRLSGLAKGAELIQTHEKDLTTFLTQDARGQQLPEYIVELSHCWEREARDLLNDLSCLSESLEHANNIVDAQQDFANAGDVLVQTSLSQLVKKGIAITVASFERHSIKLDTQFDELPLANLDPHKLLQVLVNLLTNAKEALRDCSTKDRRIHVKLSGVGEDRFRIEVTDNGGGIDADNLTRIFASGFTTKEDGHGYGLHYSSLAVKEMGGHLTAFSDGPNQGAKFVIELPLNQKVLVS